jgi:8-oxo-dGTP diphosphatase
VKTRVFCSFCSKTLDVDVHDGKARQVCRSCGKVYYENPLPVASIIVANHEREIILVKRARDPFKNMWCCPIGFAETGESIEDAALRELKEETGIEGKIIQLIDVSSHTNEFYGDLLIVTFEAEKTGGTEAAGDDARECRYFPVRSLPKLAFDSQEAAVGKFMDLKKDLWNMHDSFETLIEGTVKDRVIRPGALLSDDLIAVVRESSTRITELWIDDITTNPSTVSCHQFDKGDLALRAFTIFGQFEAWLEGKKDEKELKKFYGSLGAGRRNDKIPMIEIISSLSILKKHIWMNLYSSGVWDKAVDIYRMCELGERLVYFFDKATRYTVLGYNDKRFKG